jgi:hypothetical protein
MSQTEGQELFLMVNVGHSLALLISYEKVILCYYCSTNKVTSLSGTRKK